MGTRSPSFVFLGSWLLVGKPNEWQSGTQLVCCLPRLPTQGTGWRPFSPSASHVGPYLFLRSLWPDSRLATEAPEHPCETDSDVVGCAYFGWLLTILLPSQHLHSHSAECLISGSKIWARGLLGTKGQPCFLAFYTRCGPLCAPHQALLPLPASLYP